MLEDLRLRVRSLFHRKAVENDLNDELRFHFEQQVEKLVQSGLPPAEARRQARLAIGTQDEIREEYRDSSGVRFLETLLQDIRFALRMMRKSPGFTAVAILTLALGIGANTAIFSVVDWLILRLPPVAKAEQITTLEAELLSGYYNNGFSYPAFEDIRRQSTAVFSDVAGAMDFQMDGLSIDGNNQPIWTSYVSGNFFQMMGLKPVLGSFIEPTPGKSVDDEPVLVLGYTFWKTHLGGDSRVIGKSVLINGHPVTIIGVAPKGFHGIASLMDVQGYLPLGMGIVTSDAKKDLVVDRKPPVLAIFARLKPRLTAKSVQPVLNVIAQRLSTQYPATDKCKSLFANPLDLFSPGTDPSTSGTLRLVSAVFLILAGLVLILACLNVASLLIARSSAREREMAVRAAVGAGRVRLIRQLLTESLLLALLGCAGGVVLGLLASRSLGSINLNTTIPFVLDFQFDWRVFADAFCVALFTAAVVGIAPALRATRRNLNNLLHERGRTATVARQRTRSALVVVQVGGSLMLLIVAGLFVRSLRNVEHANLGFDPSHVLNFTIDAHEAGYNEVQARDFFQNLLSCVHALPGIETASLAATTPMSYFSFGEELAIEGYQPPSNQQAPAAGYNAVSPGYFETMRIPILSGRGFLDSDSPTSPHVAVINKVMAERYWHGQNPIGRHFANTADPKNPIEVVGVTADSTTTDITSPSAPFVYLPLAQHLQNQTPVTLQLRTSLPLATANREVVDMIHSLSPAMPVSDVQTMIEAIDTLHGPMLFQIAAGLAASLGILGLALAIIGVYGVVSYGASQRTHEIGIRMALGAQRVQILKMIFGQGFFIVSGGTLLGVLAAAAIARLVGNFLVGVSPLDAITYLGAVFILTTVALLACYIPARRAMKVDPMVALRYE
ncbi:MAG TPA: ABC transporter permease [Candidatus Acidoferrales bacterium]|nr:ABC transporter permease [Candidatus Acidoferrales bacterium]